MSQSAYTHMCIMTVSVEFIAMKWQMFVFIIYMGSLISGFLVIIYVKEFENFQTCW